MEMASRESEVATYQVVLFNIKDNTKRIVSIYRELLFDA